MRSRRRSSDQSLTTGNRTDNNEGVLAGCDAVWQRVVRRVVRQILFAGEESKERTALKCVMVADGPAEHGIARLQGVEDRSHGDRPFDVNLHFAAGLRQIAQMIRKNDANHSVCTSTDNTTGKSLTIGFQLSPASAEQ